MNFWSLFVVPFLCVNCAVFENVTLTLTSRYVKYFLENDNPPSRKVLIKLDNNLLEYVNLQPLEIIKIQNQQVPELSRNSVSNLPKVEEVEISNSGLKIIRPGALKNLPALEYLNFSHNLLENIENGVFIDLPSLDSIHLQHNRISTFGDTVFGNLLKLSHVFIDYNNLSTWKSTWFTGSRVETISMKYNFVEHLPGNAFEYYRQLYEGHDVRLWYFILSDNNLKSVHSDAFFGLTEIAYLNLGNNSLESLPHGLFRTVKDINNLVLSDNKITNVDGVFNGTKLTYVKLKNNELSCVSKDIAEVNKIYELNIDGNPVTCECVKQWEEWHLSHNQTVVPLENIKMNKKCL